MKLTKLQLQAIGSLNLSGRLDYFSEGDLERYCSDLSGFVEKFAAVEAGLNKACLMDDQEAIRSALSELAGMLTHIHADDLARECGFVEEALVSLDRDAREVVIMNFLASVASLSVDIQVERYKYENGTARPATRRHQAVSADAPKSVLAVDDIPVALNMVKAALVGAGYKFSGVTSGASALEHIGKFTPDLFVLDIEMPQMNGFELAEKIRGAGQLAPIIFLTGNISSDYIRKAVEAGGVDFIVKPASVERIVAKVGKYLNY